MIKQKYFPKIINLLILSALIYLSFRLLQCINNEKTIVDKMIKDKLSKKEITDNKIFNYEIEIPSTKSASALNNNLLLLNGSFAFILAGFINWTNILFTGTI